MSEIKIKDEKFRDSFEKLLKVVEGNLPKGFERTVEQGMVGYVVPLSSYPNGYHVTPNTPLPFIGVAAQKRHLALYHLGIYADETLLMWFQEAYVKAVPTKLNMGKSCIRFSNPAHIPYELIAELVQKMTPEQWIDLYERNRK